MATNSWINLPQSTVTGSLGRTWVLNSATDSVTVIQGTTPWVVTGTITTSPDVNIHDSAGNNLNSTSNALNTFITNFPLSIGVTQVTSPWIVDGSGFTQPISAVSLPLPTGASTSANQLTEIGHLATIDTSTALLASTVVGGKVLVEATLDASDIEIGAVELKDGTTNTRATVRSDGSENALVVTQNSQPLPTGAATAANQATEIASLASIDGKLNSLGQKTSAGSVPVVLASDQSAIPVSQSGTWTTGRTWTLNSVTDSVTVTGTITTSPDVNIHDGTGNSLTSQANGAQRALDVGINVAGVQIDPRQIRTLTATDNVTVANGSGAAAVNIQDGGNSITVDGSLGRTWVLSSGTDSVAAVQSGTWNINNITGTVSLPTGAATEASLSKLTLIQGSTTAGQSGPLIQAAVTTAAPTYTTGQTSPLSLTTSGALRVDTSGSVISGTVTVSNFPTTVDTNYGTVGASTIRTASQIGNATGAAAFNAGTTTAQTLRVVLPTDQTAIPVTQSGTWTVQQGTPPWSVVGNVASGVADSGNPLKIGAIFNTTQPTVTNAQRVDLQATSRGALIVATGADNFNINNISGIISLPTGAATSALQVTGNASLSSIDGKLNNNYGAAAGALRTASQIGNTTGAADFNAGTTGAQTLRTVIVTDQTAIPARGDRGTLTDRSGTATNVSTTLMAANSTRRYLFIRNLGGQTIWINFTTAATAASPSIQLASGETFTMENNFISTEAITVIRGGAINQSYVAKEG